MGDDIDFDDLLADAEQEHNYDDEYMMDDIEAELAMEAEVCPLHRSIAYVSSCVPTAVAWQLTSSLARAHRF